MKRILILIFSAFLFASLVACSNTTNEESIGIDTTTQNTSAVDREDYSQIDDNTDTAEKDNDNNLSSANRIRMDDIVFSSRFQEGLAFVAIKDEPYSAYCINKAGEIIFKIENCSQEGSERPVIELGLNYNNGLMLFDGNIYDRNGKITTPESLGVTRFIEWNGTYLIAEKITSDYISATKELGALNKNFEWEFPLSEDHYTAYQADPSFFDDHTDVNEEQHDITQIINYRKGTDFINGKAAVLLMNPETNELFITVVNTNLEFLFEPKKLVGKDVSVVSMEFDGDYAILYTEYSGSKDYPLSLYAYNVHGDQVAAMSTSIFDDYGATSIYCDYNDGVFVFSFSYGSYSAYDRRNTVKYYSIDGTPLEW
ncbi:MAG: hypothetical protein E7610_02295 [Ruminococcaceae bacterium]|nr:hypothetical protein [Oscillospiraceae bacterium]